MFDKCEKLRGQIVIKDCCIKRLSKLQKLHLLFKLNKLDHFCIKRTKYSFLFSHVSPSEPNISCCVSSASFHLLTNIIFIFQTCNTFKKSWGCKAFTTLSCVQPPYPLLPQPAPVPSSSSARPLECVRMWFYMVCLNNAWTSLEKMWPWRQHMLL